MGNYFQRSVGLGLVLTTFLALLGFPITSLSITGSKTLPIVEPKKHKNYKETIPKGNVQFDMVAIPGGTYLMGSPPSEKDRDKDEGPQHAVKVEPFWMSKFEVRWDEYDIYRDAKNNKPRGDTPKKVVKKVPKGAITRPTPPYADPTFNHGSQGHPVLSITHHAAMEYCFWLSKVTGKKYRLPTEAEWEWACRAGTTTAFHFGDDATKLDDYGWYWDNGEETTHPVGTKKPNQWGLYDMHGNVAEYCLDMYNAGLYSSRMKKTALVNPFLKPTKARFSHVVRGGSWVQDPKDCRSASREPSSPEWLRRDPQVPQSIWWLTDGDFVGFRVVRAVEEYDELKKIRSTVTVKSPNFIK
ncbi:MAG: formylglycine-generating enzyme family protein [Gemmataceae bacterium]